VKWLSPYLRRLVRRMMKRGKYKHIGRRYIVIIEKERRLILIHDTKLGKKHVLLAKIQQETKH